MSEFIIPNLLPVGLTLLQSTSRVRRYEILVTILAAICKGRSGALVGHSLAMIEGDSPRPNIEGLAWVQTPGALHVMGIDGLRQHLDLDPECRLVVIEPLLHFDPHAGSETLWLLKNLADERNIAILVGQQVNRLSGEGVWGPLSAKLTTDGKHLRVFIRDWAEQAIPLKTKE